MQKDQSPIAALASPNSKLQRHLLLLGFIVLGIVSALALEVSGMHDVLSAFAALMVTAAFLTAIAACLVGAKPSDDNAKTWNLSGAFAFIGFAAAMIAN
jgi:hypothetical protein